MFFRINLKALVLKLQHLYTVLATITVLERIELMLVAECKRKKKYPYVIKCDRTFSNLKIKKIKQRKMLIKINH